MAPSSSTPSGARLFVVDCGADGEPVVGVARSPARGRGCAIGTENRAFLNARARTSPPRRWEAGPTAAMRNCRPPADCCRRERRRSGAASSCPTRKRLHRSLLRRAAQERLRGGCAGRRCGGGGGHAGGGGAAYCGLCADHAHYYRNISKRWGVFVGVGLLSEEQAGARALSFRIHTRGRRGPIYQMEAVNGPASVRWWARCRSISATARR